jgi:hypothetical protein
MSALNAQISLMPIGAIRKSGDIMPIYNLKEFLRIMANNKRISGWRGYRTWIDEFDEMYEKYEREELMSKEKSNEYIFKVENTSQIDVERIARENPNKEMILVIPEDDNADVYLLIDLDFQRRHEIVKTPLIIRTAGYYSSCISKASIQKYIDRYKKASSEKPKPKITVRVKTFGDTLPF